MQKTVYYSSACSKYDYYEKQCASPHKRRCIDSTVTGSNKCVGYCQFSGHPGFLTKEQRKQHDCIRKNCFYYVAKSKREKTTFSELDLSNTIQSPAWKYSLNKEILYEI